MKTKAIIVLLILLFNSFFGISQRILIVNGFLHPINGQEFPSSLLGIENGKIILIRNASISNYNPKEWDTIINAEGQHIYPGFVAPSSTLGLTEIEAVRASNDYHDVGELNPHVRSQIAFNAESKVIETVMNNGVLIIQSTPKGGLISGSSSLMYSGGWNWEDATILKDDGIHVNWPDPMVGGGWWAEPQPKSTNEEYNKHIAKLHSFFQLAKSYAGPSQNEFDIRLEAMRPCFNGTKRIYFHANEVKQIIDIIEFTQEFALKYPVIIGGNDAYLVGQRLVDSHIPIMLGRLHRVPEREEDPVDLPYTLPYKLEKMGVKFCLQNEGGMEAMNARNIPFLAGTAMAYGLSEAEALKSITLSACEIIGIDQEYGSLEEGKSATFFISKGPALEMKTNSVTTVCLNGKLQNVTNFQEELYEKYKAKYKDSKN